MLILLEGAADFIPADWMEGEVPAPQLPISPRVGEMAGRPEGGVKERDVGGTAPPSAGFADIPPRGGRSAAPRPAPFSSSRSGFAMGLFEPNGVM